jgi:hypothetical protein
MDTVTVFDAFGSDSATVTVYAPLSISPSSISVSAGSSHSFSAT